MQEIANAATLKMRLYPRESNQSIQSYKQKQIKNLSFSILFYILLVTVNRLLRFSWIKSHFERNSAGYLMHFSQFENIQWMKSYKPKNAFGAETTGAEVAAHRALVSTT